MNKLNDTIYKKVLPKRMIKIKKPKVKLVKKKKKVDYVAALEQLRTLAKHFKFDVNEGRRLLFKKFATLTIGDVGENHVDMQKMGKMAARGYCMEMMSYLKANLEELGAECEEINLNDCLKGTEYEGKGDQASVLVVRGGVNAILKDKEGADKLEREIDKDEWMDSQIWSRKHGGVVNKNARWNNCFGPESQGADIANKKGTIVGYDKVPLLKCIIDWFYEMECGFNIWKDGEEGVVSRMVAEGNYYYDETCGIGAHGDSERKRAAGIRLGLCAPLGYRWRIRGKGVGKKMVLNFKHGDMYIMSEKAVGTDWKRRASLQLVHAAGAEKYMKQLDK